MYSINILFEDEHYFAIDKPSGLLVHPSPIERRAPNAIALIREQLGIKAYTVHRLDRPTSGVLIFAKSSEAAHKLNLCFAERQIKKTYHCVCRGYTPEEGVIDHPLKEILDKVADKRADPNKPPKDAVSEFRRLGTVELPIAVGRYDSARYSLVEVKPKTGRKHQIRRHLKHIFHPLVGDTKHGDGRHNTLFRDEFGLERLLLMASKLEFQHPFTHEQIVIEAPVTPWVDQLFTQLGWQGLYPAPVHTDLQES
ncbi:pseudouridine synthase [Amphritea balenae]|uniref:tRNA pseudouridine synthase C n=1 Tax=Amphritea balenae TaxID=452629 RepID=A0A3P1SLT3_9GAMM|nr:pseudouridine synthase [Amphritea balenae]RRC97960.1 tRNA pseudouridine(65) synthase TruC [Amphritea balenae]GGK82111.1 tRNA pseudouridine synthase C [Amphritea balenae]